MTTISAELRLEVDRRLLAAAALVGSALYRGGGDRGRIDLLDQLDLGLLEVLVQILDVALARALPPTARWRSRRT